jgi:hypothetical protein
MSGLSGENVRKTELTYSTYMYKTLFSENLENDRFRQQFPLFFKQLFSILFLFFLRFVAFSIRCYINWIHTPPSPYQVILYRNWIFVESFYFSFKFVLCFESFLFKMLSIYIFPFVNCFFRVFFWVELGALPKLLYTFKLASEHWKARELNSSKMSQKISRISFHIFFLNIVDEHSFFLSLPFYRTFFTSSIFFISPLRQPQQEARVCSENR